MSKSIREIVEEYLVANGYDGLVYDEDACGCTLDDLMPCNCEHHSCEAAYRVPCDGSCEFEHCDFHMVTEKPGNIVTGTKDVCACGHMRENHDEDGECTVGMCVCGAKLRAEVCECGHGITEHWADGECRLVACGCGRYKENHAGGAGDEEGISQDFGGTRA